MKADKIRIYSLSVYISCLESTAPGWPTSHSTRAGVSHWWCWPDGVGAEVIEYPYRNQICINQLSPKHAREKQADRYTERESVLTIMQQHCLAVQFDLWLTLATV